MHIFYACIHKIENRHNIVSSSLLLNLFLTVFGFLCYSKIKISIIFSFMSIELQFSAPLNGFFILRLTKQYRTIICKSYSVLFSYPSMVYLRILLFLASLFCCLWHITEFKHGLSFLTSRHHQAKEASSNLGLLSVCIGSS